MTSAASVPPRMPRYPAGSPCPRSSRSQHASRRPTRGDDLTRGAGIGRCGSGVLRCRHFDGCCAIDQRAFAVGPRCSVLRGPEHVDVLDTAPRRRDDEDSKTKRTRKARRDGQARGRVTWWRPSVLGRCGPWIPVTTLPCCPPLSVASPAMRNMELQFGAKKTMSRSHL